VQAYKPYREDTTKKKPESPIGTPETLQTIQVPMVVDFKLSD